MKLLFERSRPGRGMDLLPACDVPAVSFDAALLRGDNVEVGIIALIREYHMDPERIQFFKAERFPLIGEPGLVCKDIAIDINEVCGHVV